MFNSSNGGALAESLAQTTRQFADGGKNAEQVAGLLQTMQQVLPAADLFLGAGMLMFIVLLHGIGMRTIQNHFLQRAKVLAQRPRIWRIDLLFAGVISLLLTTHLFESGVWTAMLVWAHLVHSWRDASYFAANTYTSLGYGNVVLAEPWKMLCPFIAISGLFTFGWTGSVLVDVVGRVNRLKALVDQGSPATPSKQIPPTESAQVANE